MNEETLQYEVLSQRVDELMQRKEAALRKLQRAKDLNEVARLMGKFMSWQCRHDSPELPSMSDAWKLFARRSDSTLEIEDGGVYIGIDHIRRWFETMGSVRPMKGVMFEHVLASPQIRIAGDGQTARALWDSPGCDTDPRLAYDGGTETARPTATWCWGRVRADLIREEGEWRIWHYHFYLIFRTPYYTSWADYQIPEVQKGGPRCHPAMVDYEIPAPDAPTTYHNPFSETSIMYPIPYFLEDYESWSDDFGPA